MESVFAVLGVVFVVVIWLAFFTDFGKDPSTKTNAQLERTFPFHVRNVAAQKKVSNEAYRKAMGEFAVFTNELVRRGLRSDYEVTDYDLAQEFLREKFSANLTDVLQRASAGDLAALYQLAAAKIASQEEESAFRLLTLAAGHGHVDAQFLLGEAFLNAKRVPKDAVEGLKWFLLAGTQGHSDAIKYCEVLEKNLSEDLLELAKTRALTWMKEHGRA